MSGRGLIAFRVDWLGADRDVIGSEVIRRRDFSAAVTYAGRKLADPRDHVSTRAYGVHVVKDPQPQ